MVTGKTTPQDRAIKEGKTIQSAQSLRLKRFGMAVTTYALVICTAFPITRLGLGAMSSTQWLLFIGLGLMGNLVFFLVFYTGANLRFSDPSLTREQILFSSFWGLVPLYALPGARPIVVMFYLPAFCFGMLRLTRRQYFVVTAYVMGLYALLLVVEYLQGRQGFRGQYELFLFLLVGILLTWFSFFGGFVSDMRRRLQQRNLEIEKAHEEIQKEVEERMAAQLEKDQLIIELEQALGEVKIISGLLPICASCKRIRDDKGYWNQLESYIGEHSAAEFTHSICPECQVKLYPDLT